MHQIREDLDVLFRRTLPEAVLHNIVDNSKYLKDGKIKKLYQITGINGYEDGAYEHFARLNLPEFSPDETEIRYEALMEPVRENERNKDVSNHMLFTTLYRYANDILTVSGNDIRCKIDKVLGWNSISKRLGQDLFVTAWLAWIDVTYPNKRCKRNFVWPTVIKTDEKRIGSLVKKGLAENHFHFHGSTQSFSLSWAALMNHPEKSAKYLSNSKDFQHNLNVNVNFGEEFNVETWNTRIKYAAIIRILLFLRTIGEIDSDELWQKYIKFNTVRLSNDIEELVDSARYLYGYYFEQPDEKFKCLDYAISNYGYEVDDKNNNRLLAGERSFLYNCFKMQFEGKFTEQESGLLYAYILIKNNFRSELIQVNGRSGFSNFAAYQDRKNMFYEHMREYMNEAYKLSICEAIADYNLISLEARIMPKEACDWIEEYDKVDDFYNKGKENRILPHYVVHFPKKKFRKGELKDKWYFFEPRNYATRKNAYKLSDKLTKYIRKCDAAKARIRGIDACSLEIGCRPECFATDFRYIRSISTRPLSLEWWNNDNIHQELGITYHVGEDFLDIIDGLRALDETIEFLELKVGDRVGHAIVLGIDPENFYRGKNNSIYLTKQDYLDNLVWIKRRSLEWGVEIDNDHKSIINNKIKEIFRELYCKNYEIKETSSFTDKLDAYTDSWYLRADHPDLYRNGDFEKVLLFPADGHSEFKMGKEEHNSIRENKIAAHMYYLYHYSYDVKSKGLIPEFIRIEPWYIKMAEQFQEKMRQMIADKNIFIECNPTSNVLISTFKTYDKHPILKFTDYHLKENSTLPQITASVNTDDLGVFDTSIENEYALLYCAIKRERHRQGNYNDEAIYDYLNHLRKNGIRMTFTKK